MSRDQFIAGAEDHSSSRAVRMRGDRVRQLRVARGFTREQLAARSRGPDAISVATIKRAERGDAVYPASAAALARLMEVALPELLHDAEGCSFRPAGQRDVHQATVAVLPFALLDRSEQTQVFSDGLTEDLTHRLGRSWFPVIARGSSFNFRDTTSRPGEVGSGLGAHYLVEGTIRIAERGVRLIARLVQVETGLQVWSGAYDERLRDVFSSQDRLCAEIIGQIGGRLLKLEAERTTRIEARDLNAWQCAIRGLWHFHRSTAEDNARARTWALDALRRDPELVLARYLLVLSHQHDLVQQWSSDQAATAAALQATAREFEQRAPGHPWMLTCTAYACVARGERDEALARLEDALDHDPNLFEAHSLYGQVLAMAGRPDQGLHELELARRLSPCDPKLWTVLVTTALSHFVAGRYPDAVEWAERAVRKRPHIAYCHAVLAAVRASAGDLEGARKALRDARERHAGLSLRGFVPSYAATNTQIVERFVDGLRRAGLGAGEA